MDSINNSNRNLKVKISCHLMVAIMVCSTVFARHVQFLHAEESQDIMKMMGAAFNIGNDLDSYVSSEYKEYIKSMTDPSDFERYWGNTPVTRKNIEVIKAAGFKTVRIPVSWGNHLDKKGRIDSSWMARVKEVVDWALDEDLYVILNTHHEEWLVVNRKNAANAKNILCSVWRQIAANFKKYDHRLMFEGMNEPRNIGADNEWNPDNDEGIKVVNDLNAAFVKTVRMTGGNNKKRWLFITPYGAYCQPNTLEKLKIPDGGRIIVSVHAYVPYFFTSKRDNEDFSPDNELYMSYIKGVPRYIKQNLIDKGVPVMVTEFGCEKRTHNDDVRVLWVREMTKALSEAGIPYAWWDDGGYYKILDRKTSKITEKAIVKELIKTGIT